MAKVKICLDAGHAGKYNRSSVVKTYYESEMTWKLHLKLKEELEKYGAEVITTRTKQATDKGLTARGKTAKGCDLFLSIHSNAAESESVDYPLVIVPVNGTGTTLGNKLATCIKKTMGTKQAAQVWTKKSADGTNWYSVIHGAALVNVPGLILEHSFHTNTAAAKWLSSDSNLDKMAQAEAAVIAEYYGLNKTTSKSKDIEVDGVWGPATTKRAQEVFGTTVDGKVSNQYKMYADSNPGLSSATFEWVEKPNGASSLIKAIQKKIGVRQDGHIGPNTIKAMQKWLGTTADGYVSKPSNMVKAFQKWLNNQ